MKTNKKIVFLDASTVDLGDIDLSRLHSLGSYHSYKNSDRTNLIAHAQGAAVLITNKCLLGEKEFSALPDLKLVCVAATGVNNIDLQAAARRRIVVTNVAGYSTETVAEHTMMFLLDITHRFTEHHDSCHRGEWSRRSGFADLRFPFSDLEGKTLGIVGFGHIGRRVAQLAKAFKMKVLIGQIPGRRNTNPPRRLPLYRLVSQCDYVTLHCPLNPTTHHLINEKLLSHFQKGSSLLNLARGPIVDEHAVAKALSSNILSYYATDVLSQEPPPKKHILLTPKFKHRVLATPHVAWASRPSRQRLIDEVAKNILAHLNGKNRNRVS